jgi:hypothetical protein
VGYVIGFVLEFDDEIVLSHSHFFGNFPEKVGGADALLEKDASGLLGSVIVSRSDKYSHMLQILSNKVRLDKPLDLSSQPSYSPLPSK